MYHYVCTLHYHAYVRVCVLSDDNPLFQAQFQCTSEQCLEICTVSFLRLSQGTPTICWLITSCLKIFRGPF